MQKRALQRADINRRNSIRQVVRALGSHHDEATSTGLMTVRRDFSKGVVTFSGFGDGATDQDA